MLWVTSSCRRTRLSATLSRRWSPRSSRPKVRCCSAGAMFRSTIPACPGPRDRRDRALPSPGLHRPRRRRCRRGSLRAQALHRAQGHLRAHVRAFEGISDDFYIVSMSCRTLSTRACSSPISSAPITATCTSGFRVGAGAGSPAFLDQYLPVVAAGAPLPLRLPQRRDQHRARQRQLDGGAAGERLLAAVRRRHLQALADLL